MRVKTTSRYVISVLIADRVGILRELTAAVAELGGDIEGISQTVVQDYFTVIMIAAFPGRTAGDAIEAAIAGRFARGEASVAVRPYVAARPVAGGRERYVLTLSGRERPGILKRLTAFLADKGINVEDLFFRIAGPQVTHIGEVTVPRWLDIQQVQDELRDLMAPLELNVSLQHENIFRATNEVGPIRTMLNG